MNELIFLIYVFVISFFVILFARISKEALIAFISVQVILINLYVSKEIVLFGLTATASDSLSVGIALGFNLLQEFHGQPIAQKTVFTSFLCAIFYVITSYLHLAYISPNLEVSQAFDLLLAPMPRIIIASLVVYVITQYLENKLFGYLSEKFKHKHFLIRNYSSIAITQLLDTVLFSFLGLYGHAPFDTLPKIYQIIIVSYSIKLLTILIGSPFIAFSKKFITKKS